MTPRTHTAVVLAIAAAVAACSDTLPTSPDDRNAEAALPSGLRGLNAEFARVAQEVPGFGGMFYGDDGKLNVFVTRTSNPATVKRALLNRSASGALAKIAPVSEEMIVLHGEYDFLQLSRWYSQVQPVLGIDGVVFTDIDEMQNRLRIGVADHASVAQVQQAVEQYGVPGQAISIEITEPVEPLALLQQRVEPFGGGLQLVFPNPMPGFVSLCTLGFNILHGEPGRSAPSFVTNSHCTLQRSVVEGTPYYQQPVAALNPEFLIATEVQDPPYLPAELCPYSDFGYVCRYSDAAVASYVTDNTPVRFGSIYRTKFFGTGSTPGSREISDEDPPFFAIVAERPYPVVGETLDKTGRTTGWTRGPVTRTCVDVGVAGNVLIAMLCQDFVNAAVAGGDSGSPVYQQLGNSRNATLFGVLWGGSGANYVFSAMENIHQDLGAFRTF